MCACVHLGEGDGAARIAQTLPAHLRVGECEREIGRDALFAHARLDRFSLLVDMKR